jgi:RNA polymerase sigma factor (sigma-70 family)
VRGGNEAADDLCVEERVLSRMPEARMRGDHLPVPTGNGSGNGVSDEALAALARQNRHAFTPLYARYADRVYRYALAHTGSVSAAEEIVSDTMLAAIEGLHRFDPERGNFAGWLFGTAKCSISARQRYASRFQRLLTRAGSLEAHAAEDDPLDTIVRGDDAIRLRELLQRLPERDRDLVLLRYGAELTSSEIASVLDMKSSAVRVRLMRVLQRLAGELGDVE